MIEKYGRKGTVVNDIFFTEGPIEIGEVLGNAEATSNRQNISLDFLKDSLAKQVADRGGQALDNFKYVQKGNAFSFSSTSWKATGRIIRVIE